MKMIVAFNFDMPGRKPLLNRARVRDAHITIKMSPVELVLLSHLVENARCHSVSDYVRGLVSRAARRRGLSPKAV